MLGCCTLGQRSAYSVLIAITGTIENCTKSIQKVRGIVLVCQQLNLLHRVAIRCRKLPKEVILQFLSLILCHARINVLLKDLTV